MLLLGDYSCISAIANHFYRKLAGIEFDVTHYCILCLNIGVGAVGMICYVFVFGTDEAEIKVEIYWSIGAVHGADIPFVAMTARNGHIFTELAFERHGLIPCGGDNGDEIAADRILFVIVG